MAIGHMWQKLEDCNENELENENGKYYKTKSAKPIPCKRVCVMSGYAKGLPQDVLPHAGWKSVLPRAGSNAERRNVL